eukprot:7285863-Pyramimonas_sp.AAC.1
MIATWFTEAKRLFAPTQEFGQILLGLSDTSNLYTRAGAHRLDALGEARGLRVVVHCLVVVELERVEGGETVVRRLGHSGADAAAVNVDVMGA